MDKRRSARYAISLHALVHPSVGRSWLCTIRDFCEGGMLLVEQDAARRRNLPGISQGEVVGIHFSVPGMGGKDLHFRLEGKIVRVMESGVGINFADGMDDDAMTALLNYSNTQPLQGTPANQQGGKSLDLARDSESGIKEADARKIIAGIRRGIVQVLPEMSSAFFSYMDEQLLAKARDARNNAEQSEYFAAMSNLEKAKKGVGEAFMKEIVDQIDNPRDLNKLLEDRKKAEEERKEQQSSRVKLSLVNTDEFEDWLAVANTISRAEREYEKYLQEIHMRMGMLVDSWAHSEANPIGVSVVCHAFDNAIRQVDLDRDIRQIVYGGFESKSIPLLRKLYAAVTKLMEDSGLFPEIDDDFVLPAAVLKASDKTPVREDEEVEEEPGEEEQPEEAAGESGAGQDNAARKEQPASLRSQRRETTANRGNRGGGAQPRDAGQGEAPQATRRGDIGEAISNIYSTVRNLMGRDTEGEAGQFENEEEAELVQLDEVQQLLSSLRQEVEQSRGRLPIRKRLQESATAGGRSRRIPAEALESMGVVENLVNSIEDDNMLSGSAKDWIRQLELTMNKVATTNHDFLHTENPHRSMEVINQLARLGGTESGSVKRNVDEIVKFINDNVDTDPNVWDEALEKLEPLVERQTKAFSGNVQRTVKASEGQHTLVNAQRAVVDEMNSMLSGRQVPEMLLKLLVPGWRNLLVNTHLRQGEDSTAWQQHLQALEQVFRHLDGNVDTSAQDYMPPEQLLEHIEEGLDSIAFEPGQRQPLLNTLRRFIVEGEDTSSIPKVEVEETAVASTLGFGDVSQKDDKRNALRDEYSEDRDWQRWLERAERLHVGEWLEISEKDREPQIAIIAWTDEDHTTFVFVNRRGVKTHELILEDLATRLYDSTARILEEADIPLTDRASHRMLQNMHNQLTHQATHDELTGLVNRKEFERQLNRLLGLAKRNDSHHLVAYMDLDQFKVINNAAGHEAGDRLLVEVGKLLQDRLSEVDVVLARLGGDEFGLAIEDCEREAGLSVVRQLCDAVRKQRFELGDETYSLTTSCGVVLVDKDVVSVNNIMTGADSACFAAKDQGRDRVHVYEADDKVMEQRRDVLEFVSQIDRAIEQDRFVLNCQKIDPIDKTAGYEPHYEILLTVLDDNNQPMPPQDFIVAAETYNRMSQIDRWVIRNAFKFIAANILKLDDLGAFSINISGNSLTEDDFMEFVLEQFNETRLPTSRICFEITETSAVGSLDDVVEFMEKLKIIGVKFSLDDFGTGLSSYSYLRNLPVDYLKIDGIFVKDIQNNPNDYAVVKSINEIGHFMGKKTIAEFVENEEILEVLREIGVDFAQGYGVGMKHPITELIS